MLLKRLNINHALLLRAKRKYLTHYLVFDIISLFHKGKCFAEASSCCTQTRKVV